MHIALCDDCREDAQHLTALIKNYASERGNSIRVSCFSRADELLASMAEESFRYFFLDIMMPGVDGIRLAEKIRGQDSEAAIIFLSSSNEFAHQSYRVQAYDYLLKPAHEEEIFELLDRLVAREIAMEDCICLQNGRSVFRIPFDRLAWVEVNQKQLYSNLDGGQARHCPGRMSGVEQQLLGRRGFVKIHRSYIINLRHVAVLSPDGCEMFSGQVLPVSRLMYNQVHKEYMDYLFGREV